MELNAIRIEASQLIPNAAGPGAETSGAAENLEQLFATFIVKELGRSLPNGFFGQGAGADVYEGWLQEHMGKSLAESGALDLAGSIKASIDSKERLLQQAGASPGEAHPAIGEARVSTSEAHPSLDEANPSGIPQQ